MANFFTNEAVSLEKETLVGIPVKTEADHIKNVYEIRKCSEWVTKNGFDRVCLQFPDHLLPDSTDIALQLQQVLGKTVYVLGDTAYESCCVDFVAAAHINADAIIHFGPVCFSTNLEKIPCLYIYDKSHIDLLHLLDTLTEFIANSNVESCVLLIDTPFMHRFDEVVETVHVLNQVDVRKIDTDLLRLNEKKIVFVGNQNRKLNNLALALKDKELLFYDPTSSNPEIRQFEIDGRILKRRNFLIEKIKDSNTFGIVISTIAVTNYLDIIERMKTLFRINGKKFYVLSVGKPTVAKLANFAEIDIYVIITCTMNEISDSREFFKPIVTPYDVEIALNPESVGLSFSYDYNVILNKGISHNLTHNINERTDVSLISGKLRFNEDASKSNDGDNRVAIKNRGTVSETYGAGYLSERSWQGLSPNLGQTLVKHVEDGRTGIPQIYENEKS